MRALRKFDAGALDCRSERIVSSSPPQIHDDEACPLALDVVPKAAEDLDRDPIRLGAAVPSVEAGVFVLEEVHQRRMLAQRPQRVLDRSADREFAAGVEVGKGACEPLLVLRRRRHDGQPLGRRHVALDVVIEEAVDYDRRVHRAAALLLPEQEGLQRSVSRDPVIRDSLLRNPLQERRERLVVADTPAVGQRAPEYGDVGRAAKRPGVSPRAVGEDRDVDGGTVGPVDGIEVVARPVHPAEPRVRHGDNRGGDVDRELTPRPVPSKAQQELAGGDARGHGDQEQERPEHDALHEAQDLPHVPCRRRAVDPAAEPGLAFRSMAP